MTVSEKLKKIRNELGYSQEYVATITGINRSSVAQIELGKRKITSDEIVAFCYLYKLSPEYLLGTNNIETNSSEFVSQFEELTESDQREILNLIAFKREMYKANN